MLGRFGEGHKGNNVQELECNQWNHLAEGLWKYQQLYNEENY